MAALSLMIVNRSWWIGPVSSNQLTPYFSFSRSTAAFFTIFWQSGTEWRAERTQCPLTGKASCRPIQSSSGSPLTPWNSSSKLRAGNSPSFTNSRSAVRSQRFPLASSSEPPEKSTRPSRTVTSSPPIRRISPASTLSSPNRQGAE